MKTLWLKILIVLSLALFSACSVPNGKSEQSVIREAVPVTAAVAIEKDVPVELRAIASVEAYSVVSVKSQINGELTKVYFKEGQSVRKGGFLFTIDPRPYESDLKKAEANLAKDMAQVDQAKANLAKDVAQAKHAEVEANRYAELIKNGDISKEQYDQVRTNSEAFAAAVRADKAAVENAEAAIGADKANIETAKVQLGYCSIRSPMDGRTGNLIVHQGNVVKANDTTPLVVINQVDPIYVTFSVPEQELARIKRYMAEGKLKVNAIIPNDGGPPLEGTITFVNNEVDKGTGTIQLKGTFANRENRLWPGQFVNVALTLTTQSNAIVIPSQALQTSQEGQFVFVIKPDLTVEARPVVVSKIRDREAVIEKGLNSGEKVVTDGQLRLAPGTKVEVKNNLEGKEELHS